MAIMGFLVLDCCRVSFNVRERDHTVITGATWIFGQELSAC